MPSRDEGKWDLMSGEPGQTVFVVMRHPIAGDGHYLTGINMTFRFAAGYGNKSSTLEASTLSVVVLDLESRVEVETAYTSPPLGDVSLNPFEGYSAPVSVRATNLRVPNARPLLLALKIRNFQRNIQVQPPLPQTHTNTHHHHHHHHHRRTDSAGSSARP